MSFIKSKTEVHDLLMTRIKGLTNNPRPNDKIKELMFRLLVCSVWEDLMIQLRQFVKSFQEVLSCEEGEELKALEEYAMSGKITMDVIDVMEFELTQLCVEESH